jgi:acyl-CoA synthetase (AMP-forming)/AMP-acid ligase II
MPILARGGAIVLLEGHSFDPVEFLDTVDSRQVHSASWVGDAFARPVADALDAHPGRWHLSSLKSITSGGVVFTEATKRRLLAHAPHLLINDVFGASEAITVGSSLVTKDNIAASDGSFRPQPGMRVIDEAGRDVVPGSGVAGLIAFSGRQPIGYYKDERKMAEVFRHRRPPVPCPATGPCRRGRHGDLLGTVGLHQYRGEKVYGRGGEGHSRCPAGRRRGHRCATGLASRGRGRASRSDRPSPPMRSWHCKAFWLATKRHAK